MLNTYKLLIALWVASLVVPCCLVLELQSISAKLDLHASTSSWPMVSVLKSLERRQWKCFHLFVPSVLACPAEIMPDGVWEQCAACSCRSCVAHLLGCFSHSSWVVANSVAWGCCIIILITVMSKLYIHSLGLTPQCHVYLVIHHLGCLYIGIVM